MGIYGAWIVLQTVNLPFNYLHTEALSHRSYVAFS